MLEQKYDTSSTRSGLLWLCLLSIPFASCASQGTSPILEGATRIAGGSSGRANIGETETEGYPAPVGIPALSIEAGTMITDNLEFGYQANVAIGVGEVDFEEYFHFLLEPGVYGRIYLSELAGTTPYFNLDILAENAVDYGFYDDDNVEITAKIHMGLSTFLAENLALEFEVLLGGYDNHLFLFTPDFDALLFGVGLSFYY